MAGVEKVYQEMLSFFRPLWPGEDKPLVLGEGKSDGPALMLVGEAPGETEVVKGRPFVGKAGKNLDEFLLLALIFSLVSWLTQDVSSTFSILRTRFQ